MDENDDEQPKIERPTRDWPELREWANLFTAFAALALGVVSFWTTTQISGLEDYFRSEISRRNVEIETSESRAERLEQRVALSEERLENLRIASEKFSAASAEAQSSLLASQQALSKTNAELASNRSSLSELSVAVARREEQIDTFRRSRVMIDSTFRLSGLWRLNRERNKGHNTHIGQEGLEELRNIGLSVSDRNLSSLYASIRDYAPRICRYLNDYNPTFPQDRELPDYPTPPGKRVGPMLYQMTQAQEDQWDRDQASFNDEYSAALRFNRRISDAQFAVDRYVSESVTYCACAALRANSIAPDEVCTSSRPAQPDIGKILAGE